MPRELCSKVKCPLHLQIDTPRVYRGERLPRALPWSQVQALLQSIDRSEAYGRRDFRLLYLAAAYRRWSGELVRVTLDDIEDQHTVLRIRLTKFHKSRLVPLSPTVTAESKQYLRTRGRKKVPLAPDAFLLWSGHTPSEAYGASPLALVWRQLCASTQVLKPDGHPPQLHDLRRSFAVNALQRWYAQGADVQSKLPHLATYLGHVSILITHYYLKLTPELRQAASQRFHRHFGWLFTAAGAA